MSKKHVVNMTLVDFLSGRRYGESNVANFRFVAWLGSKTLFSKEPLHLCYLTWGLNHWQYTWVFFTRICIVNAIMFSDLLVFKVAK